MKTININGNAWNWKEDLFGEVYISPYKRTGTNDDDLDIPNIYIFIYRQNKYFLLYIGYNSEITIYLDEFEDRFKFSESDTYEYKCVAIADYFCDIFGLNKKIIPNDTLINTDKQIYLNF